MTPKTILFLTVALITIDILLIILRIRQPSKDRVHGGLGEGIMAMYALGIIVLLILYGSAFLIAHYKEWLTAAKVLFWILAVINIITALWLSLAWVSSKV